MSAVCGLPWAVATVREEIGHEFTFIILYDP